jgi:histidyl-tRNA synthetase
MSHEEKLSTDGYKGVRDFYPEAMAVQNHIFTVMRKAAEQFGYVEYATSVLEPAELYEVKSGEEIVRDQMYTFLDRGERRVALRPELTPSIARLVAARRRELSFPLRWYSIANMFRYERPQRGRLREHWQLNADLFGIPGPEAEIELLSLASHIMKAFGATDADFEIRINDRNALAENLTTRLKDPALLPDALRLLDKKDKIGPDEFETQWRTLSDGSWELPTVPPENVSRIMERLATLHCTNVTYAPLLTRGFDYYTGVVFEVFDTSTENPRSLFGGGRYDRLLEMFGVESVPTVGFGMGDVTIRDFLETHGLIPKYVSPVDLFICTLDPSFFDAAQELANRLRTQHVTVAVNLLDKKVGDQIAYADKHAIPFIICVGENEVKDRTYAVKRLSSGEEARLAESAIPEHIRNATA